MALFYVAAANDPDVLSDGPDCAVTLLCEAESRMEAVTRIRASRVTGVSSKEVVPTRSLRFDPGELPAVQSGEVWAKPAYVEGAWRKLA